MNNNHFALKRYLEDKGIYCHLFIFNNLPKHFHPQNDTWKIEKHNESITYLNIGKPHFDIFKYRYKRFLKNFDLLVGTGLAPFYLNRVNLKLDVFIPYGSDIYILPIKQELDFKSLKSFFRSIIHNLIIYNTQKEGIIKTNKIITASHLEIIKMGLEYLKRESIPIPVPIVYLEPSPEKVDFQDYVEIKKIEKFSFRIFSHSRHYWGTTKYNETKGNDKLIKGFSTFTKEFTDSCLVLFEYGPSVLESKKLIADLGISNKVIWVKKMPRKYILELIKKYAHVGADQFDTGYFGSTCYEYMSLGIPVMNYLLGDKKQYEGYMNMPYPPVLSVENPNQIYTILKKLILSKQHRIDVSKKTEKYFNQFMGKGSLDKILKIFLNIIDTKN